MKATKGRKHQQMGLQPNAAILPLNAAEKKSAISQSIGAMQTLADSVIRQERNNTADLVGGSSRPTDIFQRQILVDKATQPSIDVARTQQSREAKQLYVAENGRMTQHRQDQQLRKLKGHKLFAQEFFNIQRRKKRDLAGFSLHNHPDSFPDSMFDKFKGYDTQANRTTGQAVIISPRDNRLKKLQQSAIQQTRSTSIEQINQADTAKYGIGLQNHLGYGLKIDQNSGDIKLGNMQQHTSYDVTRTLPNIKTGLKTSQRLNQSYASMGQSQQSNTQNMYHGVHDFDSSSQGSFQPLIHPNDNRLSVPQIEQLGRVQSIPSARKQSDSHLFSDTVITSGGGRSPRGKILNPAHHLNEKRYNRKLNLEDKLSTDLKLLKSLQRESYGANSMASDSYIFTVDDKTQYVRNVPLPKKIPSQYAVSKSGRRQPLRHPGLKHELQGAPLSNSAQKLNQFAMNAPVFQNQTRTQETDDIVNGVMKNISESENDLASMSGRRQRQAENKVRNLSVEVNNIKDQAGFKRKVQGKLDELIDPKNIQIFNMKQSKQLYQVVTKYAEKEKEKQKKYEEKKTQGVEKNPSTSRKGKRKVSRSRTSNNGRFVDTSPRSSTKSVNSIKKSTMRKSSRQSTISPTRTSPSRQQSLVNSPAKSKNGSPHRRPAAVKRTSVKEDSKPNYYKMRGQIDIGALKKHFHKDLINNMKLAEKTGVFNVIKDLQDDAKERMNWINRRKADHIKQARMQEDEFTEAQFPGYEDRIEEISIELLRDQMAIEKKKASHSVEEIGHRSEFNLGKGSKVDLHYIFQKLMREGLKEWTDEMMTEFIQRDEVIAFMTEIRSINIKHDTGEFTPMELDLVDYIKYLVGENKNKDFAFNREDFSQRHELGLKSLKMPFDEYASQEENSMKTIANDIIERVDYSTVVQHVDEPASIVKYETNPKYNYFQVCQKDSDLAIPLLAKVVNQQLSLMNYQLSLGHVKAFVKTFDFNSKFVSRFLFKNCGLTDSHVETLFQGMERLDSVTSIVLKSEEFGQKALKAIQPIIHSAQPNQLQVLRLIDCKMPTQVTRELIQLLRERNSLRVIGLVNAKMGDASMEDLGILVSESKTLSELDISWNVLKPQGYNTLIESLGSNKTLQSVNLSMNRIVDSTETVIEPSALSARGKKGVSPRQSTQVSPKHGGSTQLVQSGKTHFLSSIASSTVEPPWHSKEAKFTDHSFKVVENLTMLIKRNKRLQHVNLTNTGLTEYMILQIGKALRRAKSLLSIHLCQNPGSTPRVKEYLLERIHCVPLREKVKFPMNDIIHQMQKLSPQKILRKQLTMGVEDVDEKPIARETIKVKQNMERKRIFSLVNDFADDNSNDSMMIFTRILGHKSDMPGSGQWKLLKERHETCWICDQEVLGIVFWDLEKIPEQAFFSTRRPRQEKVLRKVINRLHSLTSAEQEEKVASLNPRVPIITGDFTNWLPVPMTEMVDFMEQIEPQFDQGVVLDQMSQDKVLHIRRLEQSSWIESDWQLYRHYVAKFYEYHAPMSWKQLFQKHLLYKKPHLVHAVNIRPDFYKKLFMWTAMFKVGKHEFVIRSPKEVMDQEKLEWVPYPKQQPDYDFFTNVSDIRTEPLHPFVKASATQRNVRVFKKETSVFAQWKEDTKTSLSQAFTFDMEQNRVSKLVKDPTDLEHLTALLDRNFALLKHCFLDLQNSSVYPFVNKMELFTFCDRSKVLDERLNTANCDLLFVSSNQQQRAGVKQKTGLIRAEFLEYVVRLANFKFIQTGQAKTFFEACEMLIENFVKVNFMPLDWQGFRDAELWTIEVNDVLEANIEGIQKMHKYYFTGTQRYMSGHDGINLLSKDALANLSVQQAKYCLAFCKMTVKDECSEFDKYTKLQVVELLEMIGRAARIKYVGSAYEEEPLWAKIELVLDDLLPLVGYKRREVFRGESEASASDEDY